MTWDAIDIDPGNQDTCYLEWTPGAIDCFMTNRDCQNCTAGSLLNRQWYGPVNESIRKDLIRLIILFCFLEYPPDYEMVCILYYRLSHYMGYVKDCRMPIAVQKMLNRKIEIPAIRLKKLNYFKQDLA